MRATYKLGRDVITEFKAQNAGNSISGVQISKIFWGGGGMPGIGMSHGQGMRLDPRLHMITFKQLIYITNLHNYIESFLFHFCFVYTDITY